VLLLDEFEKARPEVHDIFLQALDEGIFTDSRGTKVNVRNTIIIATSNAGSRLILDTVQHRKDLSHLSAEIINHIIKAGTFKPELINRFDSTVIFEPLNQSEQVEVARLMLNELYGRMTERGFELTVSDELIHKLVAIGYNPEFGARPLRRIIQDVLEEKIAHKIIADEVHKGDTIALDVSDFSEAEFKVP
jgi:ATP-dependent Clp protease ATP-binding subunit ClpA